MAMAEAMAEAASSLGLSLPLFHFLIAFFSTLPCSFLIRFLPQSPPFRHLYAAFTGFLLSYLAFGFASILLFLICALIGYGSMIFFRRFCGILTFFSTFTFLICCHLYYMSGDAWREGGFDCTGSLMVLTFKVISVAINYQDGLLKEDELRPSQKKYRILQIPSVTEYAGYCFCCGLHFVGPVYEIRDYLDWTADNGLWEQKHLPSPYRAATGAFAQALLCMSLYLYLSPRFPVSSLFEPGYKRWGLWQRVSYQWVVTLVLRLRFYFTWSISEASVIISGFGFSGWSDSQMTKPKWDRAKNIDIMGVEFAESCAVLPLSWNIHASTWLRIYVYDRICRKGVKPGLFHLLLTQLVSAIWHGFYAGYVAFFVNSALIIAASRVIHRWRQAIPEGSELLTTMAKLGSTLYTMFMVTYSSTGFIVLNLRQTLDSYRNLYYTGTLASIALIVFGVVVQPPNPRRMRTKNN